MKIIRNAAPPIPTTTIEEFADKYDLTMEVTERSSPQGEGMRYYAAFQGAEIKQDKMLRGEFGNGRDEAEAIRNYALRISGQTLVIDAYKGTRREIEVPTLGS